MKKQKGNISTARKRQRRKRRFNYFKNLFTRIFCNRYWVGIMLCLICFSIGRFRQVGIDKIRYGQEIAEITSNYEATILELNNAHREEIQEIRASYENPTPEELIKQEAEYIARVLYGTAKDNSERDQRTVIWCILNRVDSAGYPNTVKGVCQQTSQWMGYSDTNPILNVLYNVAIKELETWHSGYRPVNEDYIYMSWSSKEIVLRDTYEKDSNTRYWQAG